VVVARKGHYGTEPPIYRRFLLTEDSVVISERGPMKPSEATTHAIDKKSKRQSHCSAASGTVNRKNYLSFSREGALSTLGVGWAGYPRGAPTPTHPTRYVGQSTLTPTHLRGYPRQGTLKAPRASKAPSGYPGSCSVKTGL
jgi:hypothetical protein